MMGGPFTLPQDQGLFHGVEPDHIDLQISRPQTAHLVGQERQTSLCAGQEQVGSTQAPTDYSGSVATSGGTMQQAGFRDYFATLGPYNVDLFGRTLAFNTWPNYVTDLKFEFMLDFGSFVHSTTLKI
jgi:hypothetical protein